jgi:hypothetical protein
MLSQHFSISYRAKWTNVLVRSMVAVIFQVALAVPSDAGDCSLSKPFHLRSSQVLSGTFQDPAHAPLPGIKVELLSGTKVLQSLRTNNQGAYDFGTVATGKYRIRVRCSDNAFCAPEVRCSGQTCTIGSTLTLNPKGTIIVR